MDAAAYQRSVLTQSLGDCFQLCEMLGHPGPYFLVVLAIRNLENPRESIVAEVYFRGDEPLPLSVDALNGQAEAAKIAIEEFDAFLVNIPSLEALVKASSGRELEDILRRLPAAAAWMIRSVRHLVTPPADDSSKNSFDGERTTRHQRRPFPAPPEARLCQA